jgi:tetratricopeptide (TPR) repeat protein
MQLEDKISLPRRRKLLLAKGWLLLQQSAYERARPYLQESLAPSQENTDLPIRALILRTLGESWFLPGEYAQAASPFEACLDWYRTSGDHEHYALVLARIGAISQLQGDESRAESMLHESVSLLRARGPHTKLFIALAELSDLEGSQGKLIQALEHAAQISGAAEALLERRDATFPDRRYISKLERLKAQANEAKWADWWTEGRALSREQGIMLALQASQEISSQ